MEGMEEGERTKEDHLSLIVKDEKKDVKAERKEVGGEDEANLVVKDEKGEPETEGKDDGVSDAKGEKEKEEEEEEEAEEEEEGDVAAARERIRSSLELITTPFCVACGGEATQLPVQPGLHVKGLGLVPVPITRPMAEEVIKVARRAPYGKGSETVVDTKVRDTWEVDATQVEVTHPNFQEGLKQLVGEVGTKLGYSSQRVEAVLYKLLLYEEGGHFLPHKDTEKEKGMFATLVVQLPSVHTGGEIVVKFGDITETLDFGQSTGRAPFSCFYAAHFGDVEHEIKTVTSGYRFALVYSLCLRGEGQGPSAKQYLEVRSALAPGVRQWSKSAKPGDKLIYFLDHEYTEGGLENRGIDAMKGQDRAILDALQDANSHLPPELQLSTYFALATLHIDLYRDSYSYDRHGDEDWEENDRNIEVSDWFTIRGHKLPPDSLLGRDFKFQEEEDAFLNLSDEDTVTQWLEEATCDSDEEGYTGNAGPSRTEEYQRCFAILWCQRMELEMIASRGIGSLLDFLDTEMKEFLAGRRTKEKILEICNILITNWKGVHLDSTYGSRLHFIQQLVEIGDLPTMREFLQHIAPKDPPLFELSSVVKKFGWDQVGDLVSRLFDNTDKKFTDRRLQGMLGLIQTTGIRDIPGLTTLLNDGIEATKHISSVSDSGAHLVKLCLLLEGHERLQSLATKIVNTTTTLDDQRRLLDTLSTVMGFSKVATSPFSGIITSIIQGLQKLTESTSTASLSMPANVPAGTSGLQNPFQTFLRGNQSTTVFRDCFTGIQHARNWARKYQGLHADWGYSVSVQVGGTGRNTYMTVTKTNQYQGYLNERSRQFQVELNKLLQQLVTLELEHLFPVSSSTSTSESTPPVPPLLPVPTTPRMGEKRKAEEPVQEPERKRGTVSEPINID